MDVYVCLPAMMRVWKSEDICRNWFFHYSMSVESNSGLGVNAFTHSYLPGLQL